MGKFKHYILTRYNKRWKKSDKNGVKVCDVQWMENRKKLFENITMPSIKNQTNQNFVWLLLFDPNTDTKWMYNEGNIKSITDDFINYINTDCDYIITTRLDNDDYLHPEFVNEIQNAFTELPSIIGVRGYKYDGQYYKDDNKGIVKNSFISVIEPSNNVNTVYAHPHPKIHKYFNNHIKIEKRLYAQVIHNRNISNDIKSKDMQNRANKPKEFIL